MTDLLISLYPWTKAVHIIGVIAWMAGLLYLPRLFVYHCETEIGAPDSERFKIMERKLLKFIMNPSMLVTFVFGISLLFTPGIVDWDAGWIYVKLFFIILLTIFHHIYGRWQKSFEEDEPRKSPKTYRIANEVPAVAMIFIVVMVVVRPF